MKPQGITMKKQIEQWDYRTSHSGESKGHLYDSKVYAQASSASTISRLENEYLKTTVLSLIENKKRYLDFACGTGRIIENLADYFDEAVGVDVSPTMLEEARKKNIKAKLIEADITIAPDAIGNDFGLITAFRFFLNAQESLRLKVIKILAQKLSQNGVLVFNVHNSRPSFLWLQNKIMNLFRSRKIPSMSRKDVEKMVAGENLYILETHEIGVLPKALHLILPGSAWVWLDSLLCRKHTKRFASHVIYVCKKR